MPAPTATKAAIQRAIDAVQACGLTPIAVVVAKDGSVRIETATQKHVDTTEQPAQILQPKKWAKG